MLGVFGGGGGGGLLLPPPAFPPLELDPPLLLLVLQVLELEDAGALPPPAALNTDESDCNNQIFIGNGDVTEIGIIAFTKRCHLRCGFEANRVALGHTIHGGPYIKFYRIVEDL